MGYIVVIGGANVEYLIEEGAGIRWGEKNFVQMEELYGGSGVNDTLRLLHAGYRVYPVLFLGRDSSGHQIRQQITATMPDDTRLKNFVHSDDFFVPGLDTPRSIIIVEGESRTILSYDCNDRNLFRPYLQNRLKAIDGEHSVIIGHIHNDAYIVDDEPRSLSTVYAIDHFAQKQRLIYLNFGATQLRYGIDFWRPYLAKCDIIQQNYQEFRQLMRGDDTEHTPSLSQIVERLHDLGIHGIITLDKFGAIGVKRGQKDRIYLLRPIDLGDRLVDSTGAGDAFCAGMVAALGGDRGIDDDSFVAALTYARNWAAYACCFFGGASHCPGRDELDTFSRTYPAEDAVRVYSGAAKRDILALLDSMI